MRIPLDKQSNSPLYRQIHQYLQQSIEAGHLKAGYKLPAVREMAKGLAVNRITVENAYQLLEADGLIEKKVGSGTFVLPFRVPVSAKAKSGDGWPHWQQGPMGRLLQEKRNYKTLIGIPEKEEDPVNFAGGIGDPNLFPIKEFGRFMQRVIKRDGVMSLSYSEPNGYYPLREIICQILASQGMHTQPENILITTGSQQAINLTAQLLLKPGDTVLTEAPTYSGAISLFKALHLNPVGIEMDENGMMVERLEEMLRTYHPKLIYTIPNFQNPTGVCLSGQRRRHLVELSDKYNIPILEDDYVGDLRYEGCALPTLKSLAKSGQVIYTSTFSKMLMPDLRIGYMISEGPVYNKLVNMKCLNDLATSNLFQRTLESYLSIGRYHSHLRKTIRLYKKRRDCMLDAIEQELCGRAECRTPAGGLFVWLKILGKIDKETFFEKSMQQGVGFYPDRAQSEKDQERQAHIRLNFAYQTEDAICLGIKRLRLVLDSLSI